LGGTLEMRRVTRNAGGVSMQPSHTLGFGDHLRIWRQRRRLSQLDLAVEADISTRHLSYVETGRANPSREMVMRLAAKLDVPLRERNVFLVAAGYAPLYRESRLDDPTFAQARQTVDLILKSHEPYPALAIDRHWNVVAANRVVSRLLEGVDPILLKEPMNVLRLSLSPRGLANRIVNFTEWRAHLFERLDHQIGATMDPTLKALHAELLDLPLPEPRAAEAPGERSALAVPLKLATPQGVLSFISTTTVFGTPADVTLQELALETFFPLDDFTTEAQQRLGAN
jgi:transcriptional regulator with XRE-family HTH domain